MDDPSLAPCVFGLCVVDDGIVGLSCVDDAVVEVSVTVGETSAA